MQNSIILYFISVPVFFVIDMIWLGFVAKDFYRSQIGHLLGAVNWSAALIFYFLFLIGLLIFVINPAIDAHSLSRAFVYGALFGFFTYATYDLTNLATLKDWPLLVSIVDMVWGAVLSASVSGVTYFIATHFLGR